MWPSSIIVYGEPIGQLGLARDVICEWPLVFSLSLRAATAKIEKKIKPREFSCAGKGEFKNLHQRTQYVNNISFRFPRFATWIEGPNSFPKPSCGRAMKQKRKIEDGWLSLLDAILKKRSESSIDSPLVLSVAVIKDATCCVRLTVWRMVYCALSLKKDRCPSVLAKYYFDSGYLL